MAEVKISQIAKKPLKVAVNNVVNTPAPVSVSETAEEIVNDIQASKPIKLTKKGKPDNRGQNLDNLAKGRAKLQESWEQKRLFKEQMAEAALQKKMKLAAKQKKLIEQSFGVEDVSSDEGENAAIVEDLKKKQIIVSKKQVAPPPPPPPPAAKAPKKKVIKYVEVETSSEEESEEEEIVYVKRQKAPAPAPAPAPARKPVVKSRSTPIINSPYPQIVFY
jgi:isoleucyl-tRNA synthetase